MKPRTRLVVLTAFQRWFLLIFVSYVALFLATFGVGLFLWFRIIVHQMMNVAGLISGTFRIELQHHLVLGLWVTVGFLFVLLTIAALQALLFSRRIAGPLFSLARHLERCEETGKLEHLNLRKGDLFLDIADKFNKLVDKIETR